MAKTIVFNPTLEWDSLPDGTYSGLGSHNCDCISSTDISEGENESFVVYPNPANNEITISLENGNGFANLSVHDITGRLVSSKTINTDNGLINVALNNLESGNYIFNLNFEDGKISKFKVVVAK